MATVTPQTLDQIVELEENDLIMTTNSEGITKAIPGATVKEFYAEASAADAPAAASVKEIYLKNSDTSKPWLNNYAKTSLPRSFIINITFNKGNTYGDASATYPQIKIYNKDNVLLGTYSVCDSRGHYAGAKCYNDGDTMTFKAIGNKLMIQNSDVRTATSDYTQYADGTIVYHDTKIKTITISGTTDNGALLASNIPITTQVVGAYCTSAASIVVLPIKQSDVWRFFIGQFAQIGSGYGLSGKTTYTLTIVVQYQ